MERLEDRPGGHYALAILDLDHFKRANDTYGHLFGDEALKFLADRLRRSIRGGDIAARVGGDEFLIFLEYKEELESTIEGIYSRLAGGDYQGFPISVSMGVACTDVVGRDYKTLFRCADQALYVVKHSGKKGRYNYYQEDNAVDTAVSAVSPIDGGRKEDEREGEEENK